VARLDGLAGAAALYPRLLRSQFWPPERLRRYAEEHLAATLRAARRIPFYRERIDSTPGRHDLATVPLLPRREIPALEQSVRSLHPAGTQFVDSSRTSGSTGMPVSFLYDGAHQASRFAARARYLRAHRWSPLARNAWIVSIGMQSPDGFFSRHARWFGARFISHLTPLDELARWLRDLDPVCLYAYPVNLDGLSRLFEAKRWRLPSLRKILAGSEVLEPSVRQRTQRVFGVDVADNYGSTEAFVAWECPAGSYHVNAEHVWLEILDDAGRPVAPGRMGRVVVTTLHNRLMPLVRYEIGDHAVAASGRCRCGRTLPLVGAIAGREINLFLDARGERFVPWHLFRPLTAREWIRQFQIIQRAPGAFTVRFVADHAMMPGDEADVASHFETVIAGPVSIRFERREVIERAASGKFMMALNEMTAGAD